ncbi:uncharacterized protein CDAR_245511 [Caerostris darwini]|uniref:Uncharacterized protein n=1 Tax=Caerostris darwini TaxID=1538125 RepID=A0AAV4NY38_9ARAC|nr:hypothetical protein CDAR_245191 [Caerostris darwini]GIX89815.1 uncharacterized protein CDAR_245511 [Caerostris darwini]
MNEHYLKNEEEGGNNFRENDKDQAKKLIDKVRMIEIHHSVKDHDKPLKLQDGSVEKYVDDIIKDEFKDGYKKVRDLKDGPSIIESASAWTNDNSTSPTKMQPRSPSKNRSIHARLIEVYREPEMDISDKNSKRRGIADSVVTSQIKTSKDLEHLINILTKEIGIEDDGTKPANEETEISIIMRRVVRQKDFESGKNKSAYFGSVTRWKDDPDDKQKISTPSEKEKTTNDSIIDSRKSPEPDTTTIFLNISEIEDNKPTKNTRNLHSFFSYGDKGWKSFTSKVKKRSHTDIPNSFQFRSTEPSFDFKGDLSEKMRDYVYLQSQNTSGIKNIYINSNRSKVLNLKKETLLGTNGTKINKEENIIFLEKKKYHSFKEPEVHNSLLTNASEGNVNEQRLIPELLVNVLNLKKEECATTEQQQQTILTTENYIQKEVEPVYQKNNIKSEISKPGELLSKINMPINITEGFPSSGEIITKHETITKEIKITENDVDIFRTTIKPRVSNNTYTSNLIFESMIEFPTPTFTTTAKEPLTLGPQKIGDTEVKIIETNMENFQRPATISTPQAAEMLSQQVAQDKPIQFMEPEQENRHAAYDKDASINTYKVTPENEAIVNTPLIGSQNVYPVKKPPQLPAKLPQLSEDSGFGSGRKKLLQLTTKFRHKLKTARIVRKKLK